MPSWIKLAVTAGKAVYTAGRFIYELVDKLRVQHRANKDPNAEAHRIQAQRYLDASKNAGHPKRTLH